MQETSEFESHLSNRSIVDSLPSEQRSLLIFQWASETSDLRVETAIELEEAMLRTVGDEPDQCDDLAVDLARIFKNACNDFLVARLKHGLDERTYTPASGHAWILSEEMSFGASATIDDSGLERVTIAQGTLDFLLWAALKHVAVNNLGYDKPVKRRAPGRATGALIRAYDIPEDPQLRSLAFSIALSSFYFVFLHEIGHHAQGHCRSISAKLSDFTMDLDHGHVDRERQAMELMADSYAARDLLSLYRARRFAWMDLPGDPQSAFFFVQKLTYTDPKFARTCLFSSIACLFYLTNPGGSKHPKREIRFISLLLMMKSLAGDELRGDEDSWLLSASSIVQSVGEAMHLADWKPDGFAFITDPIADQANHAHVMAEIEGLLELFEKLQPKLKEYATAPAAFLTRAP